MAVFWQVNGINVVKVGHRQVVNMIRQGGNSLVVKVVMVSRNPEMEEMPKKKGQRVIFTVGVWMNGLWFNSTLSPFSSPAEQTADPSGYSCALQIHDVRTGGDGYRLTNTSYTHMKCVRLLSIYCCPKTLISCIQLWCWLIMCLFVFLSSVHTVEKGVSFYIIYIYIYILSLYYLNKKL